MAFKCVGFGHLCSVNTCSLQENKAGPIVEEPECSDTDALIPAKTSEQKASIKTLHHLKDSFNFSCV